MTRRAPVRIAGVTEVPPSAPGMRIGLFGGSFNPIHEGHFLVMDEMLRRLGLDQLWALVTPGNPLKDHEDLAPLADRVHAAREAIEDPRIRVTGFEAEKGFTYTWETVRFLAETLPGRHFVWIMGADSLASFHKWERWRDIAATLPLAVYVRPGASRAALASRAATMLDFAQLDESKSTSLPTRRAPAWIYLHGRQSSQSSSAIRAAKGQK